MHFIVIFQLFDCYFKYIAFFMVNFPLRLFCLYMAIIIDFNHLNNYSCVCLFQCYFNKNKLTTPLIINMKWTKENK